MIRNSAKSISNSFISKVVIPSVPVRKLSSLVNVEVNNKTGIFLISMNRKPVNGLSLELLEELSTTLDYLESSKSRGAILTSGCASVFSAGFDLNELYKPEAERFRKFWTVGQDVWLKLYGSSFPTAAAINGHSPGGGCFIATSCEYRVMCLNYKIGLTETQLGMAVPIIFRTSLLNTISQREAEKALTLGTLYNTDDALRIGLVDEIASDKTEAIQKCEKFLTQFKNVSAIARSFTKRSLRRKDLEELENSCDGEFQRFWSNLIQPDVQNQIGEYLQNLKKT